MKQLQRSFALAGVNTIDLRGRTYFEERWKVRWSYSRCIVKCTFLSISFNTVIGSTHIWKLHFVPSYLVVFHQSVGILWCACSITIYTHNVSFNNFSIWCLGRPQTIITYKCHWFSVIDPNIFIAVTNLQVP